MKRLIIVDSCAELTEKMKLQDNIKLAPFYIDLEDNHYLADESLDIDKLINDMNNSKELVKTAAPTPDSFYKFANGYDEIFMITISGKLSGTYNSANIAKRMIEDENPEVKVHVFDSKSASVGETQVVNKLLELFEQDEDFENIVEKTEKFINSIGTIFVLENLENLIKNGRMSRIAGFVASALSIYPVCIGVDGAIEVKHKPRGLKKALNKLVDTIGDLSSDLTNRVLYITHIRDRDRAETIKSMVEEKYNFKNIEIFDGTALSTTYANKNGIIIAF